jgi:pimeloyl-ACP methyl ester carboxylesterase
MDGCIEFQKSNIRFSSSGNGKTIVLLHGFLESKEMWKDFANVLSQQFRVVAIDLPGHGQSDVLEQPLTISLMADAVEAVIQHSKINSCVMIGHSMGGYVTLEFARRYPEKLKGFGLFHSHAAADTEAVKENRRRTINIVKRNKTGFIVDFVPDLFAKSNVEKFQNQISSLQQEALKTPEAGIIAALEAMRDRSGKIDLLTTTVLPVLFIAGKEDSRIPLSTIIAQAMLPGHSEILILAGTGHMGFLEESEKTLGFIRSFAERWA